MSYFDDKPGINYCKRDGKTYRYFNDILNRHENKHSGTFHKRIVGGETLSQKNKLKLYNSTNDNFMPCVKYSLNKSQYWNIFDSPTKLLDKVSPYDTEHTVAMVKSQVLQNGGSYTFFAIKQPNQEIKFIEPKSGNGASFMCLHNELVKIEPIKGGEKRRKGLELQKFRKTPSVLFVVEERHLSDYVYESSVYRYKSYKIHNKWTRNQSYLKKDSYSDYEEEIFNDDLYEPCTSHQTNLTFGDCVVQKSVQKKYRRRNYDSFEKITLEDPAFDKIKQRPKVVFDSSLSIPNIESIVFSYNKNSIALLNFDGIEFMYDRLWLNEEKTKCLLIIPKSLNMKCSNFDSFMILEFFGGKRKRLRATTNSIHKNTEFLSTNAYLNLKKLIIKIWKIYILNSEISNTVKKPIMTIQCPNILFSNIGSAVGDFDLLFHHQSKSSESIKDFEMIDSRCNICNYKNATILDCGHSFCQECATKMIKNQIENYADKLCCTFCSTSLDSIFIFYSTPLLLLRAYLRSKFLENKNTVKCPNCNDDLIFESKDALNIKCKQCCILFCQYCKKAPHFPLPCSKMNQWTIQMLKQRWFNDYGDFNCLNFECKERIELSRYHTNLEYDTKIIRCLSCYTQYVLSWPQMRLPKMFNYHKNVKKYIEVNLPPFLSNSVASISIDAFFKRITMKYQNKMVQKIAEHSSLTSVKARKIVITRYVIWQCP